MKFPFFKSVKGKFFTITLILVLITGISATTAGYLVYTNRMHSNSIHVAESNLQFLSDKMNSAITKIDDIAHWCQNASEIRRFIMTPRKDADYGKVTSQARLRLDEELEYNPMTFYIQRVVIGNTTYNNFLQCVPAQLSTDRQVVQTITSLPYYEEGMSRNRFNLNFGFQPDPFSTRRPDMIPSLLPIYHTYTTERLGFVYVEISRDLFLDVFENYTLQEGLPIYVTLGQNTYAVNGSEITLITHDYEIVSTESRKLSSTEIQDIFIKKDGKKQELISYPLEAEGCFLTQPLPSSTIQRQFHSYLVQIGGIVFLIALLGIGLYLFLMRTVNRPVKYLNLRLSKISQGDFSTDAGIEWENEFGDIGRSINVLAEDINNLMKHRIAYENEKKDYEYKMLQSQINPHFLYNTLNSIKWMAITQGAMGIAEMVTSLSRLLKSIAKGTSTTVTIKDELALLDDYFLIQKYRYGGSIEMTKEITDSTLTENEIPRFTLQPIIENAIFHGIEPKGTNGTIRIRIYEETNHDVCITVTDDGIGMSEEKIRTLLTENNADKTAFFKDVGVSSVHKRLEYCFGEGYGLHITSIPKESTTVLIRLKNTLTESEDTSC